MNYYFTSNLPCVLKIDGEFRGQINGIPRKINPSSSQSFIEILPVNLNGGVNFFLDQNLLNNPPLSLAITDLKGGYIISYRHIELDKEFKVLAQKKFPLAVVTVYQENGYKLSVETNKDFYLESLNEKIIGVDILPANDGKGLLIALHNQRIRLFYFDLTDKIIKKLTLTVDEYKLGQTLETIERNKDMAKHVITKTWSLSLSVDSPLSTQVIADKEFNPSQLPDNLLPFAFAEEFLVGGDLSPYLSSNILQQKTKLKGYLGEFIAVCPPPKFRDFNQVGLVYKSSENKFFLNYLNVEIEDGKIQNLTLLTE